MKFVPPGSLDLLLDAMCNVFGSVLVLAILIGGTTVSRQLSSGPDSVDPALFSEARQTVNMLKIQLKNADLEYQTLQELADKNIPDSLPVAPEIKQKQLQAIAELNDLALELQRLKNRHDQLQKQLKKADQLKNAPDPAAQQKALDLELQKIREQQSATPPRRLELPQLYKISGLQPWRLLISPQELFVIGSDQDIRRRIGRSQADNGISVQAFTLNNYDFFLLRKQDGLGIKLSGQSTENLPLPPASQTGCFIELLVEPGAIAQAAAIMEILRAGNYFTNWRIISSEGAVLRTSQRREHEVAL